MGGEYEFECSTCYGTVSIDGVLMHTKAWCLPDLSSLWGAPEQRGSDVLIPGAVGTIPRVRRVTATRHSLPFIITGQCDKDGVPWPDEYEGLATNWSYLMGAVLLPTNTGDGTRTLTWTVPGGTVVTAAVHVLPTPKPTLLPKAMMRTTLELSDPFGDLHL